MLYQVYPTISTDIIKKFSEEMPEITVYAGIDQYRSSMKEEEYRIRRKQLAGAKGFFTQPFFDMRYLEIYADLFRWFRYLLGSLSSFIRTLCKLLEK